MNLRRMISPRARAEGASASRSAVFTIALEFDHEDSWWVASCNELPGAVSQGRTIREAVKNLTDAIAEIMAVRLQEQAASKLSSMNLEDGTGAHHHLELSLTGA